MSSDFKLQFGALNAREKALVLSHIVHSLTIAGRTAYGADEAEAKLRRVNEMMHTIAGKLSAVLEDTSKQYPDDVFVDILFETAGPYEPELARICDRAVEVIKVRAH